MTYFIDFEPIGRRGECKEGNSLLESARSLGIDLVNICGGEGNCGTCLIQVLEGTVSQIEDSEREYISDAKLSQGYRLACRANPISDCKVRVLAESLSTRQRTQVEGQEVPVSPEPVARAYFLELSSPSLDDLRSDEARISEKLASVYSLSEIGFDFALLGDLSTVLRENNWRIKAIVHGNEVIAVLPEKGKSLGVAVDLGTTKIAMYLMELETGQTLTSRGLMNPQISYGEDIMTRMSAAQTDPDLARHFQEIIVQALNEAITEMCAECKQLPGQIVNLVVVGNTAMHHLFLGFPVRQLGRAPYVPEVSSALDIKARDLGLKVAPGAFVHMLPNIAGYVGADHVAMLLATDLQNKHGTVLAIDIGTNTEICLAHDGAFTSLSTASGPAFEGAHIKYGMRAAPGAIERFQILDGVNKYQTIDNAPAVGLCGSGILDVLAQLYEKGIINHRGKMMDHPFVRGEGKEKAYAITSKDGGGNELTFSQKDIEQLQLAKGAIRTGIDVLLSRHGLTANDLDEIIIAGAFGTYLDVNSAMVIGLFPNVDKSITHQVGNAAGIGAKQALISKQKRREAQALAKKIAYIELAGDPNFAKTFAKAMRLGN